MKKIFVLLIVGLIINSCDDGDSGIREDSEAILSENILLPMGTYIADEEPEIDESVIVGDGMPGNDVMRVYGGNEMTVNIPFESENGNVTAAGMRFGENGKLFIVPIEGAEGKNEGTLSFNFTIPPEICDEMSRICHDIKCYEFAVTDAGNISRANINELAMMCGACNEPSCRDLVDCDNGSFVSWSCGGGTLEDVTSSSVLIVSSDIDNNYQFSISGNSGSSSILFNLFSNTEFQPGVEYQFGSSDAGEGGYIICSGDTYSFNSENYSSGTGGKVIFSAIDYQTSGGIRIARNITGYYEIRAEYHDFFNDTKDYINISGEFSLSNFGS